MWCNVDGSFKDGGWSNGDDVSVCVSNGGVDPDVLVAWISLEWTLVFFDLALTKEGTVVVGIEPMRLVVIRQSSSLKDAVSLASVSAAAVARERRRRFVQMGKNSKP